MGRVHLAAVALMAATMLTIASRPAAQAPASDEAAPLFDDTRLEDIQLLINSRDWETLKASYKGNTYYPADWRWRDTTVRNVGIRSRGTGSRSGIKPGLRIDFDRYSTRQKFLGLKSVVLRNNTQDPSHIRERLSMLLFARMGVPAPRELHARLFVNNAYAGLYTIVEAVDRAFLQRTFGEDKGFLYDYDYPLDAAPYYFEYRGSDPSSYVPLPFNPETNDSDPQADVIERMVYTINSVDNAQFRTAIDEFVDVRGLIRYVAIEAYLGEQDGFLGDWGMNNYYLYRPREHHQFKTIPWDKSQAFFYGPTANIWHNITDTTEATRNRLIARLIQYSDLRDLYLDTLVEAARSASPWLGGEIDREVQQIREAVFADDTKPFSNEAFDEDVAVLKTFARERSAVVIAEVARSRAKGGALRYRR